MGKIERIELPYRFSHGDDIDVGILGFVFFDERCLGIPLRLRSVEWASEVL